MPVDSMNEVCRFPFPFFYSNCRQNEETCVANADAKKYQSKDNETSEDKNFHMIVWNPS